MKINSIIAAAAVALVPVVAFAENPTGPATENVTKLFTAFGSLVNMSIGILVTLALAVFFWGLVTYIFKLGNGKGEEGKNLMIYGIIALFIMVSIWGIITFIGTFLGVNQNQAQGVGNLVPKDNYINNK
ncbi:MAG: hypothetical protein RI996_349 [Candidatus Parcubacteria bacterium]|jgi:hypothetical protein